ncbi:hypothetical protein B0H16DRAFT_1479079 [Mycena metata]|uniref:Uncharacterized protein n=1 Tax=Mycena metata TaxID=1033252 RepID=A0AAD7H5Y5_9AGAR|nr:hypothetical protein B0H16DRAFT_1479079 [Mycena metata]
MSNRQEAPRKKEHNNPGWKSLLRRRQRSNHLDSQPPQSKFRLALQMQALIILRIPHVPTNGGVAPSDASTSKGIKTRKQKICEKAKLIWQGLYKLTEAIESIVPAPFHTPVKIFNAISDAAEKYFDNEENLKDMMDQLSACLIEANGVLLQSDDYGVDVTESSKKFAKQVIYEALEIHKIQNLSLTGKAIGQDQIMQQINQRLDHLKQGTADYHVCRSYSSMTVGYSMLQFSGQSLRLLPRMYTRCSSIHWSASLVQFLFRHS